MIMELIILELQIKMKEKMNYLLKKKKKKKKKIKLVFSDYLAQDNGKEEDYYYQPDIELEEEDETDYDKFNQGKRAGFGFICYEVETLCSEGIVYDSEEQLLGVDQVIEGDYYNYYQIEGDNNGFIDGGGESNQFDCFDEFGRFGVFYWDDVFNLGKCEVFGKILGEEDKGGCK
ncbi:MAG: hypothetical protein EZS28_001869 [Streblomastix strix]|uniref:Uncharacterized protein n=1 Tax=Streblomastix strix TaxID=222440 RepID=A0A5J4X6E3_9EUKA|nr:MAG: hypothetical protein EZS28_001869 [Streblomastix strix]